MSDRTVQRRLVTGHARRALRGATHIGLILLAATASYIASLGPAAWLACRYQYEWTDYDYRAMHWYGRVYAPLLWLEHHSVLGRPIQSYEEWWLMDYCGVPPAASLSSI